MTGAAAARRERMLSRLTELAQRDAGLRAAIVIGSCARAEDSADEWSDIDIIIVAIGRGRYLARTDWIGVLGAPAVTFVERTAVADGMERRVLFDDGTDVDLILLSPGGFTGLARHADAVEVFRRGARVLVDKDGAMARLDLMSHAHP